MSNTNDLNVDIGIDWYEVGQTNPPLTTPFPPFPTNYREHPPMATQFSVRSTMDMPEGTSRININQPRIITFSGIDDAVGFSELHKMRDLYHNVEFGVLAEPNKH